MKNFYIILFSILFLFANEQISFAQTGQNPNGQVSTDFTPFIPENGAVLMCDQSGVAWLVSKQYDAIGTFTGLVYVNEAAGTVGTPASALTVCNPFDNVEYLGCTKDATNTEFSKMAKLDANGDPTSYYYINIATDAVVTGAALTAPITSCTTVYTPDRERVCYEVGGVVSEGFEVVFYTNLVETSRQVEDLAGAVVAGAVVVSCNQPDPYIEGELDNAVAGGTTKSYTFADTVDDINVVNLSGNFLAVTYTYAVGGATSDALYVPPYGDLEISFEHTEFSSIDIENQGTTNATVIINAVRE